MKSESTDPRHTARAAVGILVRRNPRRTALMIALLGIAGLGEGVGTVSLLPLLGHVTDESAEGDGIGRAVNDALDLIGLPQTVGVLLAAIAVGIVVKSVFVWLALREAGNAAADTSATMRQELVDALMRAEWRHFTDERLGALSNAMSTEATRGAFIYVLACRVAADTIQVAIYLTLALAVSLPVTAGALGVGAVMFMVLNGILRSTRRSGREQAEGLKSLVSQLTDGLLGMKPLKAMAREEALAPLLRRDILEIRRAQRRESSATALLRSAQEPIIVTVMAAGTWFALERADISLTTLVFMAFVFYRTISRIALVQYQVQALATYEASFWSFRESVGRAAAAREHTSGRDAPPLRRALRIEKVSFSHEQRLVLHDLSVCVRARQLTALVGPSGSGKTTLIDLVAGLFQPDDGEIWVDDTPLSSVDVRSWRARLGYVPQEPVFFHDTIRANITLGDHSIADEDLQHALAAAGADGFVNALPAGLDTDIGERGAKLSGGQRQRIALARALVRRPDLLLLDEATTGLDPETERSVCDTLRALRSEVTILAVSHQRTIVDIADEVLELQLAQAGERH